VAGLVEVSVDEFHVALLQLNRPEARNALSAEMRAELVAALERLDADPEVRCIVLAGTDDYFAAGADIRAMAERPRNAAPDPKGIEFWIRLSGIGTPTIAAVSGYAFGGGCELALACDMIVCDEKTRFGQPEITLGIIPGGGGTQRLARAIGKQRAMEYVLTGRRWDAHTAERWGLVNKVVPAAELRAEVRRWADKILAKSPTAIKVLKHAFNADTESAAALGTMAWDTLDLFGGSDEAREGVAAFNERRPPDFSPHR
jgi:enoyl-CoA hydratase/carnithine racemase